MATFTAQVEAWTAKAKANMEQVVLGSIEDVFELATRRQASIKETGTYREGFVPVDTGNLIGTARIAVNGVDVTTGKVAGQNSTPPDVALALANVDIEDFKTVRLYFTANYAPHVEYGTGKMPGRFFVRNAVIQWQTIMDNNARYIGSP